MHVINLLTLVALEMVMVVVSRVNKFIPWVLTGKKHFLNGALIEQGFDISIHSGNAHSRHRSAGDIENLLR